MSPRIRRPRPRDYAGNALLFGVTSDIVWTCPTDGGPEDAQLARLQHELVLRLREDRVGRGAAGSIAAQARREQQIPKSTWSDYVTGHQWMPTGVVFSLALNSLPSREQPTQQKA